MDIKIRRAKIDDIEEILTLFVETIKSTCQSDYIVNQLDAWIGAARKNGQAE